MYTYVDKTLKGKDTQWEPKKKRQALRNPLFSDWWEDGVCKDARRLINNDKKGKIIIL